MKTRARTCPEPDLSKGLVQEKREIYLRLLSTNDKLTSRIYLILSKNKKAEKGHIGL